MDFKALREQIIANMEEYNTKETKIVVTKLLDFLVDISEKRSKLEEENKALFSEMQDLRNRKREAEKKEQEKEYQSKIEEVIKKANKEAKKIIDDAKKEAEEMRQEIIGKSIEHIESIISSIEKNDEEARLYRQHILSIFRKTIFRFSDTNYYIIRSDDKDFQDLLQFFEVDKQLQKHCDENIAKLDKDPEYQKLVEMVKEHPQENELKEIKEIMSDEQFTINDKEFEIKEDYEPIEDLEEQAFDEDEIIEEPEEDKSAASFLDIINQYKKKK